LKTSLWEELEIGSWNDAVIIALGSNLKGSYPSLQALLEAAVKALPAEGLRVVARSSWWTSAAWPDPAQPAYLNGVVIVETRLDPAETIAALQRVERAFGRTRDARNAARTLDLDLIAHGRTLLDEGGLTVPHPRAAERRFVMGPLAEIAPGWRHPVSGEAAQDLAVAAAVGGDAFPLTGS
jgi:2-amino-4-hydroxy-6-hydroxymethyldihydropteridine diphosphokinase